ncbi:MAG: squalene synthase HpnC [bacterium]
MITGSQARIEVVAGIIRREGRLLICKRPEEGLHSGLWEFPGGKIETGESPEGALAREIKEELDIHVEVGPLRWETKHDYPKRKVYLRFYECWFQGGEAKNAGVARHEWVFPGQLDNFDFLPADAPLIETLREGGLAGAETAPVDEPLPPDVEAAYRECAQMVAAHYENFPVASWLLPRGVRPHVAVVYAFARCADDFADERFSPKSGPVTDEERIARLDDWERRLEIAAEGSGEGPVFTALTHTLRVHGLSLQPFRDLLAAFRQDVTVKRYADFSSLREYCRLSANPVGRLVLMLHGVWNEEAFRASDAICSGLQIANHLQDVKADYLSGRVYLPQDELRAFGVSEDELAGDTASPDLRALVEFQIRRTRGMFAAGLPLLRRTGGKLGRELRAIFRGGLAALESIARADYDILKGSPRLHRRDKAACFLAALYPVERLERMMGPEVDVESDADFCRWVARSSRSNFYPAIRFLPPAKRRGLSAIYAFCRVVDDIADGPGEKKGKRLKLRLWRRVINQLGEEEHLHPIVRELAEAVSAFGVSRADLRAICEGMEMDLARKRYGTFEELQGYCHKVASAVGLACMKVFGESSPVGDQYARSLGLALQLTNILRDFRSDAKEDRIYIPLEDIDRFGVTEEEILLGGHSKCLVGLLRFEARRAQAFFEEADALLPQMNNRKLLPARFMGRIYRHMLEKMIKADFPAAGWKPSLSKWAKLREAFLCLLTT